MKKVEWYDGYDMTKSGVNAFIQDWGPSPVASPNFREIGGRTTLFSGSRFGTNEFIVAIELDSLSAGINPDVMRNTLLSLVFDETAIDIEHRIDVLMDDGVTRCYRMAVPIDVVELHKTVARIRFRSSKNEWTNIKVQKIVTAISEKTTILPKIDGSASAWPVYRVRWTGQRGSSAAEVGWKYEQVWEVENGETSPMRNECIMFEMGDTRSLVSGGKARADAFDVRVWANGKRLRRDIINWNTRRTRVWVTIDEIPAGQTLRLSVVYGNPSTDWDGGSLQEGSTRPAFMIFGENSNDNPIHGSTPSTSTTLSVSTSSWMTDMWVGATVYVWSTGGVEQSRTVLSNTSNTLTVSTWTTNPTSSYTYAIHHSSNSRHTYYVRQASRGSWTHNGKSYNLRGGWSLNRGQKRPSRVRFADQIPGAWSRTRVMDNNDRFNQPRYSYIDIGSGDYDAFALFDTTRSQGDGRRRAEDGQYDGVMLTSIHGFSSLQCDYRFYNPIRTSSTPTKGTCNFKIISMDEGGETWADVFVDGVASANLNLRAVNTYDVSDDMPRHIGFCVVGRDPGGNDVELSTKIKKDKEANARWGDVLYVLQDTTRWSVTQVEAEDEKYEVNTHIRLNGSTAYNPDTLTPAYTHGMLRFGGDGHRVMLDTDEQLVHDTRTGATHIRSYPDDDLVLRVPYAALASKYLRGPDGVLRRQISRDAVVLRPPREYASNGTFPGNVTGWTLLYVRGGSSASFGYDSGMAAAEIDLGTNSATAVGERIAQAYNSASRFAVIPGEIYTVSGRLRTTTFNVTPGLSIVWDTGETGYTLLPGPAEFPVETLASGVWHTRQAALQAPSWARYGYVAIHAVNNNTTGISGDVYFDDITTTDAIIVDETAMGNLSVTIEYEEGWLV